jgi:glutathione S-transferase
MKVEVNTLEANAKHEAISTPFYETANGDLISESTAISYHLARSKPSAGLLGDSKFEQAQVHDWVCWAEEITPLVGQVSADVQAPAKNFNLKRYTENFDRLTQLVNNLGAHLSNKKMDCRKQDNTC